MPSKIKELLSNLNEACKQPDSGVQNLNSIRVMAAAEALFQAVNDAGVVTLDDLSVLDDREKATMLMGLCVNIQGMINESLARQVPLDSNQEAG